MVEQHVSASAVLCARKQHKSKPIQLPENIQKLFSLPQDDSFFLERNLQQQNYSLVAGCDEVGRGPLAGPVVAATVILPDSCDHTLFLDSKKLSPKKRESLFDHLQELPASIGIGVVSHKTIDTINILQASLLAMKRSVIQLQKSSLMPDFLLVDGKFHIPMKINQQAIIRGESRSASIAAASIIAKVTRDAIMVKLHERYPQYNFIKNKGYPTKEHRQAIAIYGICPQHRLTFRGVKEFV